MGKDEIREESGELKQTVDSSRDLSPAPDPQSERIGAKEAVFLAALKTYEWPELEDESETGTGKNGSEAESEAESAKPEREAKAEAESGKPEREAKAETESAEPETKAEAESAKPETDAKAGAGAVRWSPRTEAETEPGNPVAEPETDSRKPGREPEAKSETDSRNPMAGPEITSWKPRKESRKPEPEAGTESGNPKPEVGTDSGRLRVENWKPRTEPQAGSGRSIADNWKAVLRAKAESDQAMLEAGAESREPEAVPSRGIPRWMTETTEDRREPEQNPEQKPERNLEQKPEQTQEQNQEPNPEQTQEQNQEHLPGGLGGSVRVTEWFTGPEEADEWTEEPEERQRDAEPGQDAGQEESAFQEGAAASGRPGAKGGFSREKGEPDSGSRTGRAKRSRKKRKRTQWLNRPAAVLNGLLKPSDGLWAAFCVPIAVMVIIFWQRGIFPFGEESFLRTDMYHQYAPFFSEFHHKLSQGGSLFYSWNIGMGVNFSALYAYYLASPLNWLLLLCPQKLVIEFMTYGIVLKIGLSGLTFAWYLRKRWGKNDFGVGFFGIFYALSGYMAAYSWNIMWLDCILLFPLVMFGLERLVEKKDGLLYGVCLGLCILSNYYISIMICIFMVIYFVALLILDSGQHKTARDYVAHGIQFTGYSLLSGGVAAAVLIPEVYALRMTVSIESSFPKTVTSYFSIFDMIARHMGNVETEIGLDHWPNIYCGVAVLMLFTLYLACSKVRLKEKAVYCGLLLMFFASFSVNTLNFIWHGFHFPNSLPCRQSFIYIFLMLVICYRAYMHLDTTPWSRIVKAFWGAVGFVILAEKLVEQKHFEFYVYYVAILFLSLYGGLLYLYKKRRVQRGILMTMVMVVVAIEAAANTTITSVTTTSRTSYIKDNDDVRALTQSLIPSSTFFRVEKVTRKTKNDGAWMNFPSVSLFSSTANAALTDFFKEIGCEGNTNAYSITGSTPLVDSLFSVRYGLYSSEQHSEMLELIDQSGDTWLYRRLATLPVGFLVSPDLEMDWQRDLGNPAEVQNNLCDVIGAERVLQSLDGENYGSTFRLMPETDGDYYVYVANRKVKEVKVKIGEETRTFNNVNRGFLLELGECEAGTEIEITNEEDDESLNARAYRFSNEGLWSVYEILGRNPFTITKWKDTCLEGEVHAVQDGVLFTSVPYDKGWTVEVDGVKQETRKIFDTFLSVEIPEGTHEISMSYEPEGLRLGIGITAASILCLACIAGYRYRKRGGRQMRSIFRMPSADLAGDAKRRVPIPKSRRRANV